MTMSIPETKKMEILTQLRNWHGRQKCTKTQLLSQTGKLSHICRVVRTERIFLWCLFNLTKNVKAGHHHISLDKNSRGDIELWLEFLPGRNRSTIIPESFSLLDSDIRLFTDACRIGLGGIYGHRWIQARFPRGMAHLIQAKQ